MNRIFFSLIRFEPNLDGGGGLGGPAIFDEPAAPAPEPAAPAPGLDAPAPEPAAPQWDDQRESQFQELVQFQQHMQGLFQQAQQEEQEAAQRAEWERQQQALQPPPPGQLPEYDPLDPTNVAQHIAPHLQPILTPIMEQQQQIQQQLQQLQPFALSAAEQQGERLAEQVFDQLQGEQGIGEFDRDLALRMAVFMQGEGFSGQDALHAGALEAQRIEQEIRQNAQTELQGRQQELGRLRGEPAPTGAPGAEEEVQLPQGRLAYREQARATLSRIRPLPPQ